MEGAAIWGEGGHQECRGRALSGAREGSSGEAGEEEQILAHRRGQGGWARLGFGSWEMRRAHAPGPGGNGGRWAGAALGGGGGWGVCPEAH